MKRSFSVSTHLDVPPEVLFSAWLDSEEHAAFTGGPATIDPSIGGAFSVWDGYITGTTLEKDEGKRIAQSWRTTEFPDGSPDSRIEIIFEPANDGTNLTINHSGIPEGQADDYESGWQEYYFDPIRKYYAGE